MRISVPKTSAERNATVRIVCNGVIGLAAGAFAASGIFATFEVATFWVGFWTGVICTGSTIFGAGFNIVYRPVF
jgi:uncharacterized membrane protein